MNKAPLIFLFVLATCLMIACKSKENKDCSHLKSGQFYYYDLSNRLVELDRNDLRQTEFVPAIDSMYVFGINWIGDCEYELWIKSAYAGSANQSEVKEYEHTRKINVKVIEVHKNYYLYKAIGSIVIEDTIWIGRPGSRN